VGPDIDPKGVERIRSYLGKPVSYNTWEDAATTMQELNQAIYPEWAFSDWMTMARRAWAQQADGQIRPDYDPNIAVPFNTQGPTAQVNLWPMFRGLNGIPLLIVRGGTSDILSAGSLVRMKEAVPSASSVEVPGIGHAPFLMEPSARDAISHFLKNVPPTPKSIFVRTPRSAVRRVGGFLHLLRILKQYKS
ncbi:MAG: alpha/beta hydrolase, partial [Rhodospirillaceae bacterium]|nr:alpha/beta hydrolase [Rhodospirillaceae bacterium]